MSTTLGNVYGALLSPYIQNYKGAKNEKERSQVVKRAADAVTKNADLIEDRAMNLPKDLKAVRFFSFLNHSPNILPIQAITRYIKTFVKKEGTAEDGDPKPKKIKQVYNLRDVIKQNHRNLIEVEIPYESTHDKYIGSYQRAVTAVLEKMKKKDLKEAEKVVELWNAEGAPPEVKLK
jgi:hypothetical protein